MGERAVGLKSGGHLSSAMAAFAKRSSRRRAYSAASLAPLLFRGLPPAFFSTGARNLPV